MMQVIISVTVFPQCRDWLNMVLLSWLFSDTIWYWSIFFRLLVIIPIIWCYQTIRIKLCVYLWFLEYLQKRAHFVLNDILRPLLDVIWAQNKYCRFFINNVSDLQLKELWRSFCPPGGVEVETVSPKQEQIQQDSTHTACQNLHEGN